LATSDYVHCAEPVINFSNRSRFLFFTAMILLQFLEACIGAFDLWLAYILDILICKPSTPQNLRTLAAFMYGHDVPLWVAHMVYTIGNPNKETHYLVPYAMGGYYAYFYARCNSRHMAQNYDIQNGLMMWVNGLNYVQLEPVHLDERLTPPFDCTRLRHSPMANYAELAYSAMNTLCNVQAFDIMQI